MTAVSALGPGDIAVLVGYFGLIGLILWGVSRHQAKAPRESSTESYFLAERSVSWWAVAASLFASNIGSEHFVGLAGGAASTGVAMGWFEVGAIPVLLVTGLFFLPTYLNAKIQTTPDYLERRYSLFARTVMVAVSLGIYVFSRISATLYAGELILTELVNINKLLAVVLLVAFTALYTVLGGLEAVIYTEALQTGVLLVGGMMMLFYALSAVDGFGGLVESLHGMPDVPDDFLHFFRPVSDPLTPWTGFVFGYYVYVPWYFGVDQVIVQRALAAKDVAHGQLGCVVAACLKFIPFFIMVVPGLCARVLISERLGPEEAAEFKYDQAYPWLVINVIPRNMRGLIVSAMLSSLMSALASVFNSAGTLFALNIWRQAYPEASEQRLVLVGRGTVVALALVALAWLPVMPLLGNSLFTIINKPPAYLAPPIFCLYLWGMLSVTPTRRAGEWTLIVGIALGALRFVLEILEDVAETKMFGPFTSVNYLHFAAFSFVFNSVLLFALSFALRRGLMPARTGVERGQGPSSTGSADVDRSLLFRKSLFQELMEKPAVPDPHESPAPPRPTGVNGSTAHGASGQSVDDSFGMQRVASSSVDGSVSPTSEAGEIVDLDLAELREVQASPPPGAEFQLTDSPRSGAARGALQGEEVEGGGLLGSIQSPAEPSGLRRRLSSAEQDIIVSKVSHGTCLRERPILLFSAAVFLVWAVQVIVLA